MEITINLKTVSTIVAIVAVIIGIIEGLNVFSLSGLVPDFVFYWSLAIIIAILGLLGVYISKMDIRIAAIQYIILGLGLFIAIGYYGVIGCVIFIVAGVLAIAEYVQTKEEVTTDNKLFLIHVPNGQHPTSVLQLFSNPLSLYSITTTKIYKILRKICPLWLNANLLC